MRRKCVGNEGGGGGWYGRKGPVSPWTDSSPAEVHHRLCKMQAALLCGAERLLMFGANARDFVWSGSGVSARATGFWTADFFFSSPNTCAEVDHNVAECERTINRPGLRTLFHL